VISKLPTPKRSTSFLTQHRTQVPGPERPSALSAQELNRHSLASKYYTAKPPPNGCDPAIPLVAGGLRKTASPKCIDRSSVVSARAATPSNETSKLFPNIRGRSLGLAQTVYRAQTLTWKRCPTHKRVASPEVVIRETGADYLRDGGQDTFFQKRSIRVSHRLNSISQRQWRINLSAASDSRRLTWPCGVPRMPK
jgi:hypothetical protein